MNFKEAFEIVIGHEGGYVNDPNDLGGETKFGISKRAFPNEDIKNLTLEKAKNLYKANYWDKCNCELLPEAIRYPLFDYAVNAGVRSACVDLQSLLGVIADGVIGPKTIESCKKIKEKELAISLCCLRLSNYVKFKNWSIYGKGWTSRIVSIMLKTMKE
jgi:lysozyme family protein